MTTYRIGRGTDNDIVIRDGKGYDTVSTAHAELVLAHDGRYYLTDRGSRNGTYVRREGKWKRVRQEYVGEADRILLGDHETSVADLMRRVAGGAGADPMVGGAARGGLDRSARRAGIGSARGGRAGRSSDDLPSGPVEFDPETGEIVKKSD